MQRCRDGRQLGTPGLRALGSAAKPALPQDAWAKEGIRQLQPPPVTLRLRGKRQRALRSPMSLGREALTSFPDHLLLPLSTLWKPESSPPSYRRPGNKSSAGLGPARESRSVLYWAATPGHPPSGNHGDTGARKEHWGSRLPSHTLTYQGLKLGGREGARSPSAAPPRRPASVDKYLKM